MRANRSTQAERLHPGDPRGDGHSVGKTSANLVTALQNGERTAVEELYSQYGRMVFGFLLNRLRDRGAAEDVQQQVFLEVWTRGASYDPDRASLLTWIMQIARSRAIDHTRRQTPEPVDVEQDFASELVSQDVFTDEVESQMHMAQLLERIPREESDLLRARFHRGLSQSEIADETGLALGTVKMRMVQGLRRLGELMHEEGGTQ